METIGGERRSLGQVDADLVTLPTAARRIGVGERQLRRALSRGELPFYQIGGWPRLRWLDVLAWVGRQRRQHRAANRAAPP